MTTSFGQNIDEYLINVDKYLSTIVKNNEYIPTKKLTLSNDQETINFSML